MESFLASVIVFVVLVFGLGFWQRHTRRAVKIESAKIDQEIGNAAEIAQRRHKQRFGRASTGLEEAIQNSHAVQQPKS